MPLASESKTPQDPLEKLSYAVAPEWVQERDFITTYTRNKGEPITRLHLDIQHSTTPQSSYQHTADRLENMQAVQNLSQWQLNFDPQIQTVCLHKLTVHRNDASIDYALPGKARILQREQDLDSFILRGSVTLLFVLDDIRPGDILESSFTITENPKLLPDSFSCLRLDSGSIHLCKSYYSIRHPSSLSLKWKAGSIVKAPSSSERNGVTELVWETEHQAPTMPEPEMPSWSLPPDWIQASTIDSWAEIANAAAVAWDRQNSADCIESEIASICGDVEGTGNKIESIIRFVQDEFRYLSVNAEVGGQIPTSPDEVLNRRYGDCKDLSHLLVEMLRRIGLDAFPILVHHEWGKRLPEMLPSPNLFNHVIVEYEFEGQRHWVDPTIKLQGGTPQNRFVPIYYYGLRVSRKKEENLAKQPERAKGPSRLQVHETFMLDSAGNHNLLRIQTVATDSFADSYRRMLDDCGDEGFQDTVKEQAAARYRISDPIEEAHYKDDRSNNTWQMVELYKLPPLKSGQGREYSIELPPNFVQMAIPLPEEKKREYPVAIPNELALTHIYELRSKAVQRQPPRKENFRAHGVHYEVHTELNSQKWKLSTRLQTNTDHVPEEKLGSFNKMLENMLKASSLVITLPAGHVRLHREANFFCLPEIPKFEVITDPKSSKRGHSAPHTRQRLASHPDETLRPRRSTHSSRSYSRHTRSPRRHSSVEDDHTRKIVIVVCIAISTVLSIIKILLINNG